MLTDKANSRNSIISMGMLQHLTWSPNIDYTFRMNSPSAELNAYILDYKAQKTLQNSPCYNTPAKCSSSPCSRQSKSWLRDVLTVPPELRRRHDYRTPTRPLVSPSKSTSLSVTKWLSDIDRKIEKRFPKINQTGDNNSDETIDNNSHASDETINLLLADPSTGTNELVASYDSHPNITKVQTTPDNGTTFCDCAGQLQVPAWVDDILNDEVCDSCIEKSNEAWCNHLYRPDRIEQSVDLPEGYRLLQTRRSHRKRTNKGRSKSAALPQDLNETPETTQKESPETENIMKLLERAIGQLQEVKVAVEDNTVSAITDSAVSCTTSQALSDLPVD